MCNEYYCWDKDLTFSDKDKVKSKWGGPNDKGRLFWGTKERRGEGELSDERERRGEKSSEPSFTHFLLESGI